MLTHIHKYMRNAHTHTYIKLHALNTLKIMVALFMYNCLCRIPASKSSGRSDPVSPNGASAVTTPHVFLQASDAIVQPGFDISRNKGEKMKERSVDSTKRNAVVENGCLEEFVDQQRAFSDQHAVQCDSGLSTSGNSSGASTRNQSHDGKTKSSVSDGSQSNARGNSANASGRMESVEETASISSSKSNSPAEAPYLEGYGKGSLTKMSNDPIASIPVQNGEDLKGRSETTSTLKPKPSSLEENLSPWMVGESKATAALINPFNGDEKPTPSLNPFDDDDDDVKKLGVDMPLLSGAVDSKTAGGDHRKVRDGFTGQGFFSDEENMGFGASKSRQPREDEEKEVMFQDQKLRPGLLSRPPQERPFYDEYSYNYGDHGVCMQLALLAEQ